MLEYDNSAFYYFALTLLGIYILPGTWYAIAEFFRAFLGSGDVGAKARSKSENQKALQLKKQTTGWTRLNNTTYIANLCGLFVAWSLFFYLVNLVMSEGVVKSFDPYSILGIEQGAALNEIKKAYRRLSLKYHPDKNIGNKVAEEMFMKIAKAYEALTDETSKDNYEKFGNPDGKQALEVSIGLPKILLENPKVVLVLYLIGMVVIIPSVVGIWYSNSKQYGEKNILYETYNAFYTLLQDTHRLKNLPEILAASGEYRKINVPKPSDNQVMNTVFEKMKKEKCMLKPKFEVPQILRGNLLLHTHLARATDILTPELKTDLQQMLLKTPDLIEGLVEISSHRKWLETSLSTIKLSQCIVQAIWYPNNISESFAQLPCLTAEQDFKKLKTAAFPSTFKGTKSLAEFVKLSREEQKKGLDSIEHLSADEKEEILSVVKLIPNLQVDRKLFVEEDDETDDADDDEEGEKKKVDDKKDEKKVEEEVVEKKSGSNIVTLASLAESESSVVKAPVIKPALRGDQILQQDLVTLKLSFSRQNLTKGETVSPVHAPFFPGTIYENWWIILIDRFDPTKPGSAAREPVIHAFEKIANRDQTFNHEIKFMAPTEIGHHEYTLHVISDCYLGVDQEFIVPMEVHSADLLPEYQPHPEDVELDNEPTLFEQVMAANLDDDSSDEEDEDEKEEGEDGEDNEQEKKNKKSSSGKKVGTVAVAKSTAAAAVAVPTSAKKSTPAAKPSPSAATTGSSNSNTTSQKKKKKAAVVVEDVNSDEE